MFGAKNMLQRNKDPISETFVNGIFELRTQVEKNHARHFLRHHMNDTLKNEYTIEEDPKVLWNVQKNKV